MKHQEILPGALYMVSTPIGNLEDITLRALRLLRDAQEVWAEDTRESKKLLEAHGISREIRSFHGHSGEKQVSAIVEKIRSGASVVYISDAGTPGLCDPGAELVLGCYEQGLKVTPVPGASALIGALSVSGFLEPDFAFHGFFPRENKDRQALAEQIRASGGRHFFYESPHRFHEFLEWAKAQFPEENFLMVRELTKKFETIRVGPVQSIALEQLALEPRGEYVLALEIKKPEKTAVSRDKLQEELRELADLGANQKILVRAGIQRGLKKNEAYALALAVLEQAK
jgi:16S rRNA (cytidine1402-2'-O)-methyltransferase